MAITTANILSGAWSGSELVTVLFPDLGSVSVVVCRGEFVLGTATTADGVAQVAVPMLAAGDVIQASVTERGNKAGIPVRVMANPSTTSGWLNATTVRVTNPGGSHTDYTVADYIATFGEMPGAVYDPLKSGLSKLPADYDNRHGTELGFDVQQVQQAGSTTLRVVPRSGESLLVGWNGATPGSAAPLTVTASASVPVSVVRDSDQSATLTRNLSVIVLPAPTNSATPAAGDITSACWRNYGGGFIRAMINSAKPCEAQLVGYDAAWKPGTNREATFIEVDWSGPVPSGTYTCNCRVVGETNPANYVSFIITVS